MWPVHTWLPDAHVEAPTAGSVILAGILLKLGGYGFIRFSLPMFPLASAYFTPLIFTLSAIAVIYTSLVALAQIDMKKLIAYSSIAHMGFVTMGTFAVTSEAVQGAVIQMLSHGLVSAALFLCVGVLYDRLHTHEIARFGGLVHRMPAYAFVFMVFTLAAVGLPGHQRVCRRVPDPARHLQGQHARMHSRGDRLVPRPGLYALPLSAGHFRHADPRRSARPARSEPARESCCLSRLLVLVLWMGVYPELVSAADPGFGRSSRQQVTAATERPACAAPASNKPADAAVSVS